MSRINDWYLNDTNHSGATLVYTCFHKKELLAPLVVDLPADFDYFPLLPGRWPLERRPFILFFNFISVIIGCKIYCAAVCWVRRFGGCVEAAPSELDVCSSSFRADGAFDTYLKRAFLVWLNIRSLSDGGCLTGLRTGQTDAGALTLLWL